MPPTRKKSGGTNKKARLKALREQLRRGLYPIDSIKLTYVLWRAKALTPNSGFS
jgi:hypothetical protein